MLFAQFLILRNIEPIKQRCIRSDFKKLFSILIFRVLPKRRGRVNRLTLPRLSKQLFNQFRFIDIVILVSSNLFKVFDSHRKF